MIAMDWGSGAAGWPWGTKWSSAALVKAKQFDGSFQFHASVVETADIQFKFKPEVMISQRSSKGRTGLWNKPEICL
jgi:hypothetical protein